MRYVGEENNEVQVFFILFTKRIDLFYRKLRKTKSDTNFFLDVICVCIIFLLTSHSEYFVLVLAVFNL